MLNEPFGILDNIPLIWCFASFETHQSGVLEIATQKRGLPYAPQPTKVSSELPVPAVQRYVCPLIRFHTSSTPPLNLCVPTCATAQESSCAGVCRGGETREMKSEEGALVIARSPDTWSLSGEEIPGAEAALVGAGGAGGGMSSI